MVTLIMCFLMFLRVLCGNVKSVRKNRPQNTLVLKTAAYLKKNQHTILMAYNIGSKLLRINKKLKKYIIVKVTCILHSTRRRTNIILYYCYYCHYVDRKNVIVHHNSQYIEGKLVYHNMQLSRNVVK